MSPTPKPAPEADPTHTGAREPEIEGELRSPILAFNLENVINELQDSPGYQATGKIIRPLARHSDLRATLIVLRKGAYIAKHSTPGCVSIECIKGRVLITVSDRRIDLPTGGVVILASAMPHDVTAAADSALLVTITSSTANS